MARKAGNSSKSSANVRPMTRSRSGVSTSEDGKTIERTATKDVSTNKIAELTYYTKMKDPTRPSESYKTDGFQVISKRQLKGNNQQNYERLQKSLTKVKQWEKENKDLHQDNNNVQRGEKEVAVSKSDAKPGLENPPSDNFCVAKFVTNFNVFLYSTCFFTQTGTLPYLTKKLGANINEFVQLQTVFALAQLSGGPFYGRLGDLMGDRIALILAFTSAMLSYVLLGMASSIQMLFVSRLFSVFMHVMQGSQMAVTHLSSEEGRTKDLARLGFSYGMGMIVGPSLGGLVTKLYGEQSAALLAAAGSAFSIILVHIFIPRKNNSSSQNVIDVKNAKLPSETKEDEGNKTKEVINNVSLLSILNIKEVLKLLFLPQVAILLLIRLASGIPIGILQSMLSVIAIKQFGLEPDQTGFVLSYVGCISLFMQGFGISLISSRFSDKHLLRISTVSLAAAFASLALVRDLQDFLLLLLPMTCSMTLIHSILTACLTKSVARSSTGQILGLNMGVHSAIRIFTPSIGGYMISNYGFMSLGGVGVLSNLIILMILPFANTL